MYISKYFMFPLVAIFLAYDIYQKYFNGCASIDSLFIEICWFVLAATLTVLVMYIHYTDCVKAAKLGLTFQQYRKSTPFDN